MHKSFPAVGEKPFGFGYSIVDPETPERVGKDAQRIKQRGLIQLCTMVDAWAPGAQEYHLGRKCMEAVLDEPGWSIRILTKNAAVEQDFDLIQKHQARVLVGVSLTATPEKTAAIKAVEPNASTIPERMAVMENAHRKGFRTYGMLCPLLPGVVDSPEKVEQLINFSLRCGVEEIFVEPVNARGPGLKNTEEALRQGGFITEAEAVARIRHAPAWSTYVTRLLNYVQQALKKQGALDKLRFLLYPSNLSPEDEQWIRNHGEGVRWLGKEKNNNLRQIDSPGSKSHDASKKLMGFSSQVNSACKNNCPEQIQKSSGLIKHSSPPLDWQNGKTVQQHPDLDALMPYLGTCKKPSNHEEQLIDYIDTHFMFDGFPGVEEGVLEVGRILKRHAVDPVGQKGQRILAAYIDHTLNEMYGDFDRYVNCPECGKYYKPNINLEYVNNILAWKSACSQCVGGGII
jgi:DNA repair photolyase